jgi:CheY-like chemotaxis protein/signal transduction histidine kinase
LSNLELDAATGTYTYAVALPIPDGSRGPAGVIRAIFNLRAIQDSIGSVRIGENGFVMAMGRDGRIFGHPRGDLLWKRVADVPELSYLRAVVESPAPWGVMIYQPPVAPGDAGSNSTASTSMSSASTTGASVHSSGTAAVASSKKPRSKSEKRGWVRGSDSMSDSSAGPGATGAATAAPSLATAAEDSWILAYSRMFRPASLGPLGWTVVGTVSRGEVIAPILAIRQRVFFIEGMFVLLAVPLVWFVSRRLAKPLNDLARRADLIAAGDLGVDLNVPSRNEIARLASALSSMMDSVRDSNRDLQRANVNLERTVAERTGQLQEKTRLLEDQSKQVLEASRLKSQFLANMSHELRTPLNAILALSEILGEKISGDLNDEQVKQVTIVNRSGRNLLRLINDILDLSKIEAGRMEVHVAAFELRTTITAIRDTIEPLAAEKGLKFEITADPALPALVSSDDARIRQILVNLLGNAVKFTEKGTVSLAMRRCHRALPGSTIGGGALDARPDATEPRFWLEMVVSDTGIGIAPEAIGKIFDEFQQADGSTTRRYGGTGLGLAISKKLTELMGGEISLESVLGKGSTFRVLLPVEAVTRAELSAQDARRGDARDSMEIAETPGAARSTASEDLSGGRAEASDHPAIASAVGPSGSLRGPSETPFSGERSQVLSDAQGMPPASRETSEAERAMRRSMPTPPKKVWVSPFKEESAPVVSRLVEIHDDSENLTPDRGVLLIVDDDSESLYVYRQFLSRHGYQVVFATNGEEVASKARQFHPEAIILDLMLPQKSGWEVLEELKVDEELKEIPVIISSVLDHRERGVCVGAFRYLTKPMSEKELLGALKDMEKARNKNVRRVLVVDDDTVDLKIAKTLLEKAGVIVLSVQKAADAVQTAVREAPDIIVLDLMMPEVDGFDVLAQLKSNPATASIPVLVHTAKEITEEDRRRLLPSARRILQKTPLEIEVILDELRQALESLPQKDPASSDALTIGDARQDAGGARPLAAGESPEPPAEANLEATTASRSTDSRSAYDAGPIQHNDVRTPRRRSPGTTQPGASRGASVPAQSRSVPATPPVESDPRNAIKRVADFGDMPDTAGIGRSAAPRARILLVEDDAANQYSIGFMLRSEGYEVLLAENGQDGITAASRERPDIILMDMMMPVMSGFDATRALKRDPILREIPIIALTAAAMAGDRERTLAAGCDDYVSKPIDRPLLLQRITHWLASTAKETAGAR